MLKLRGATLDNKERKLYNETLFWSLFLHRRVGQAIWSATATFREVSALLVEKVNYLSYQSSIFEGNSFLYTISDTVIKKLNKYVSIPSTMSVLHSGTSRYKK